ncbi:2-phospho-L-lactate transferase [Candidatus Nitrosocosmicus arcticus]|uniref:LPPG:FO 2-phospho-L-lactate transferase n=1 Tax=Candidatus Nitrosocosmicus arcticus TaxID=2035267 RepID=A0A557SR44_9ARCH|nr:2-phospho-L-lactate transferase [Candidatus Nitrosocosmicus arcticus]TVP39068.1 LPPG:FO 2-phospho-L-lactate transferase [Candidatus Nitrosocosmicus arcticus]
MITILAGGTGSVKLVRGMYRESENITIISNVADNFWHYGLYVCPDIDTIIYGLSNNLDKKKGWGVKRDSFNFLKYMATLGTEKWFNLGDKDLTTHVLRTQLLKEGRNLTEITKFFTEKYGLSVFVLPASDTHYESNIVTEGNKRIHLQEYWIKYQGSVPVCDIIYKDIEKARVTLPAQEALEESKLIIFAPGNPITSIGPIISIPGMKNLLKKLKNKIVMISPLISNKAVSGPCEVYMKAKNIPPNLRGLIDFYSEITSTMIFDQLDKSEIERKIKNDYPEIKFCYTDILMTNLRKESLLARYIISNF